MAHYFVEPWKRKYVKRYGFLLMGRYLSNKYRKRLLDTATEIGLDAAKNVSKKLFINQLKQQGDWQEMK